MVREKLTITVGDSHIQDKTVGELEGENYYTYRKPNHFMRKFQGFGISIIVLKELKKRGIKNIFITYDGKDRRIYRTTLENYDKSTDQYTYKDNDPQKFVKVTSMYELTDAGEIPAEELIITSDVPEKPLDVPAPVQFERPKIEKPVEEKKPEELKKEVSPLDTSIAKTTPVENISNMFTEQKPHIKLERGMRGQYGWEIKLLEINVDELEKINNEMLKKFGGKNEE